MDRLDIKKNDTSHAAHGGVVDLAAVLIRLTIWFAIRRGLLNVHASLAAVLNFAEEIFRSRCGGANR
ncbi:MAG: hypothetical protein ACREXR_19690 [Gammaproteobacteria bacterium]